MPPAVALLNYVYKLWYTLLDFLPNWNISRGFLYVCIIYIAGRISAAVRAGDILLFSLAGPVGYYTGNIINQSLSGPVERYTPLAIEFGIAEKHSVSENFAGFSLYISSEGSAKLRWVGRVAKLG